MKPKKLVISAFGPYAGESTIDFEKLGEHGLYLITGIQVPVRQRSLTQSHLPCMGKRVGLCGNPECSAANTQRQRQKHS